MAPPAPAGTDTAEVAAAAGSRVPVPDAPTHVVGGRLGPVAGDGSGARVLPVSDPATGAVIAGVPAADELTVAAAVRAAAFAARAWARTHPTERAAAVAAWADRIAAARAGLAGLQTLEGGKPLADSAGGIDAGVATLRQYAQLGPLHRGHALQGAWDVTDLTRRVPRGVAAVITPWNDPVAILLGLVGANLVVGNPVVIKPSERTPLNAFALVELAGGLFPDGVVNLVLGDGETGRALVAEPGVAVVAHVGSVATGVEIAGALAPRLTRSLLELGGNDPLVVDADVDPVWAAGQAAHGAFADAGQICNSVERVYVHRDVARPFVAALVAEAERRRLGSGFDDATDMGPLIDEVQRAAVHAQVTEAVDAGARVLTGGVIPGGPGSFYPPTVLVAVEPRTRLMREETFGPVAPVQVVDSFDEGLARAADTPYGLAATVLTASLAHAQRAGRELDVGTVKINAVFGGAPGGAATPHGASGWGVGYGPGLLDELTRVRVVHQALPPPPRP
jgi:succinate-semialdehyde dehydrogenase/glutarate-semialdehyde dehydrogenase